MRAFDLTTGAAKLDLAMESLQHAKNEALEHWDDQTIRTFQEDYLQPLDSKVRKALDAIHRLSEVLARAQRECESY